MCTTSLIDRWWRYLHSRHETESHKWPQWEMTVIQTIQQSTRLTLKTMSQQWGAVTARFSNRESRKKADKLVFRRLVHDQQITLSEEVRLVMDLVYNRGSQSSTLPPVKVRQLIKFSRFPKMFTASLLYLHLSHLNQLKIQEKVNVLMIKWSYSEEEVSEVFRGWKYPSCTPL